MASDSERESFYALCDGLVGRAEPQAESEVGAAFDSRLEHSRTLVEAGECAIGLEDLASNLYEFGIPLTTKEAAVIERLAITWGVSTDQWSFVKDLVP